jgi:hypothetical protein
MSHRGQSSGQLFVVLLFALVDAAVLQQHQLAGGDLNAFYPVGDQGTGTAQQLAQSPFGHGGQGLSSGLNAPSVGRPRWLVTMTAAPASSAIWMQGTLARMRVSSVMLRRIVLRHVQVSPDEDALAARPCLGHHIIKTDDGLSCPRLPSALAATTRTISRHLLE